VTVYLGFNEPEAWTSISAPTAITIATTGGVVISGYNRAAMILDARVEAIATLGTAITEGYAHCRIIPKNQSVVVSGGGIADFTFAVRDELGNIIGGFYENQNNQAQRTRWYATYFGDPNLYTLNSTTTGTLIGDNSGAAYDVDLHFKIDNTVGFLRWYVDGIMVREFIGDTQPSTSNKVGQIRSRATGATTASGSASQHTIGHIVVADTPTFSARVHTLPMTVSTPNAWTGTPTDVTGTASAGNISETTNDDEINFSTADLATAVRSGYNIGAVIVSSNSQAASGSPVTRLQGRTRVGGTPYNIETSKLLAVTFAGVQHIANTNPATSAIWLTGEVNSAEFGLQAKT